MKSRVNTGLGIKVVSLLTLVGLGGALLFWPVEHKSAGKSEKTFVVKADFEKFRQIMVRKNATEAIVLHAGMTLLEERSEKLQIDASKDDRPILNAILGKSKTEINSDKHLKVSLSDPELDAKEMSLTQHAYIEADQMRVDTTADGPAGKLQSYSTSMTASPVAEGTRVVLNLEMLVQVSVPRLFVGRADARVQQAAEEALSEQQAAMQDFIEQFADKLLILP